MNKIYHGRQIISSHSLATSPDWRSYQINAAKVGMLCDAMKAALAEFGDAFNAKVLIITSEADLGYGPQQVIDLTVGVSTPSIGNDSK